MNEFYDILDEYLSDENDASDIRLTVRRCWFYDFAGYPMRVWQGKGKLFTTDGSEWLGSIDARNVDLHKTPNIQDGRDGSSARYEMSLTLVDMPNQTAKQLYDELKKHQSIVANRKLICYLALFKEGEALRPQTPLAFFKELTMMSSRFSEKIETSGEKMTLRYVTSISAKDGNFGRSNVPGGTYADTIQKERASQLGAGLDKGAEYLGLLANRTYQLP